jgi:hypothetical protein
MILYDFSGTLFAAIHVSLAQNGSIVTEEKFLRHLVINSLRHCNNKYKDKYGEMVVCLDSRDGYWRKKDVFPYYKYKRSEDREASPIDWNTIFTSINKIVEEVKTYFPYKVLQVPLCEADDLIAVLAKNAEELTEKNILDEMSHPVLIVSNDKDMKQLHKYKWVRQYFPQKDTILREADPKMFLIEQVLKGDKGDDIPNVRSAADSFVVGKRQLPVTAKFIREFLEMGTAAFTTAEYDRYRDNKKLIDLSEIPDKYEQQIIEAYKSAKPNTNKMDLMKYFCATDLKQCLEKISEFY